MSISAYQTLSAGLSSVFPILMVAPLLIADYQEGGLDTDSKRFRFLTALASVFGLTVPVLGANPVAAQMAGIFYLVNRKDMMGEHKAGFALNLGLLASLLFACIISYTGILALL